MGDKFKWKSKTVLDLNYADDLIILYEHFIKLKSFGDFEGSGRQNRF